MPGCGPDASSSQPRTLAFESDYDIVAVTVACRDRLDAAIEEMAANSEFTAVVRRLACLRGVSTLTAFALTVEIGDWDRFTGNTIGSFVGLVPSEHSCGASRSQGSITKTGNSHARRLLVEAAWHHRKAYRPTATLRRRWQQAPPPVVARAHAGNQRLHQRWTGYLGRKKRPVVANVAVARELAGWCWSLAVLPDPSQRGRPGGMSESPAAALAAAFSALPRRSQGRSSSARTGPLTRPGPDLRALHLDTSSSRPWWQRSRMTPSWSRDGPTR